MYCGEAARKDVDGRNKSGHDAGTQARQCGEAVGVGLRS